MIGGCGKPGRIMVAVCAFLCPKDGVQSKQNININYAQYETDIYYYAGNGLCVWIRTEKGIIRMVCGKIQ